jgi:hypothetical protein
MPKMFGYGEDALTLWILTSDLSYILKHFADKSDPNSCHVFYRLSFGRAGGNQSSQFGEFDFIILSKEALYLGESKWDGSSEKVENGLMILRDEQLIRHNMFSFYIEQWMRNDFKDWNEFIKSAEPNKKLKRITKPLAPTGSLLADNLETVLNEIKNFYDSNPVIKNVLLYFYKSSIKNEPPRKAPVGFTLISIEYSEVTIGKYINLSI